MLSFSKNIFRARSVFWCILLTMVGCLLVWFAGFLRRPEPISEQCILTILDFPKAGFDKTSFTYVFTNGSPSDLECWFGINDTSNDSTITTSMLTPILVKSHSCITSVCEVDERFTRWRAAASYEKKRSSFAPIRFLQRETDVALKQQDWILFSAQSHGAESSPK